MMTQWSHLQNKKQSMNSWKVGTSTELCESFDFPLNWANLIPGGKAKQNQEKPNTPLRSPYMMFPHVSCSLTVSFPLIYPS